MESTHCSNCNQPTSSRNVAHKIHESWGCRNCGHILKQQERESFTDDEAIRLMDLSTIQEWLSGIRRLGMSIETIDQQHGEARYCWEVAQAEVGRCTILYDPMCPRRLDVRLVHFKEGSLLQEQQATLSSACANHGVQPTITEQHHDTMGKKTTQTEFGAQATLAIQVSMMPELLPPIIQRLQQTMLSFS